MVPPRQPLRVGHEAIGADFARDLKAAVAEDAVQVEIGAFVLERVPFLLEILLEEVAVAYQTQLARELPVAWHGLPVLSQNAAAERLGNGQIAPAEAQVVVPIVVNAVGVDETLVRPRNAEQSIAGVLVVRA